MEIVKTIWNYFAAVLPPTAMMLLALLIWSEYKMFSMRKRIEDAFNTKDATIKELTLKTIDAVEGYSKLTNILEKLSERVMELLNEHT
jgi:hypothetical protein